MKKYPLILVLFIIAILIFGFSAAMAQTSPEPQSRNLTAAIGSGITYQGYLEDTSGPVTNHCDFQFSLYGSESGTDRISTTQTQTDVWIENGYFTVQNLDFGSGAFKGNELYVAIAVRRPSGSGDYNPFSPRKPITPAPYALSLPGLYTTPGYEGANITPGYEGNEVKNGAFSATIGGGGVSWGPNYIFDHADTVSGGGNNQTGSDDDDFWNADGAIVSGGWKPVSFFLNLKSVMDNQPWH